MGQHSVRTRTKGKLTVKTKSDNGAGWLGMCRVGVTPKDTTTALSRGQAGHPRHHPTVIMAREYHARPAGQWLGYALVGNAWLHGNQRSCSVDVQGLLLALAARGRLEPCPRANQIRPIGIEVKG